MTTKKVSKVKLLKGFVVSKKKIQLDDGTTVKMSKLPVGAYVEFAKG